MEAVEGSAVGDQRRALLGFEHLLHRAVPLDRMRGRGRPVPAAVFEPAVEVGQRLEAQDRLEEASAGGANLVLDLPLLPARTGIAGGRLDEMVRAHLQETAVEGALTADEDRRHGRPHVVVDAAPAGAAKEAEGLLVSVEDHLLRLARIGAY